MFEKSEDFLNESKNEKSNVVGFPLTCETWRRVVLKSAGDSERLRRIALLLCSEIERRDKCCARVCGVRVLSLYSILDVE